MKYFIATAALVVVSGSAAAQASTWGQGRTCQAVLAANVDHPQFRLVISTWDGKTANSLEVRISKDAVAGPAKVEVHGVALNLESTASGKVLTLPVREMWSPLLDAISFGSTLSVTTNSDVYEIPLTGSANAVKSLRQCAQ